MTMELNFADGFTSGSSPSLIGLCSESYPIENDKSVLTDFDGLEFAEYTSVIGVFEVERFNALETFRQSGNIIFSRRADNTWKITVGIYDGDDLLQTDESNMDAENKVYIEMNGDQVQYKSGNLDPYQYEGNFKINLTRVNT